MTDSLRRKDEHLAIVLGGQVSARAITTGLERVRFVHQALPELDLDAIDLITPFVGRTMAAPLIVSSMTGGPARAGAINAAIAEAAGALGIGFGVGSQRVAIESDCATAGFDKDLRRLAGAVPILANFGAAQLRSWRDPLDAAQRAIAMIEADALIVHLNPLQEAVQAEGDRHWRGLLPMIGNLARALPVPVIAKEVGSGLSDTLARRLYDEGVHILDVAGAGGTSWAAVEGARSTNTKTRAIADAFHDWGIPTADSLRMVRHACPMATVIGSGGLRTGLDVARAIRLGADLCAIAAGVLPAALNGPEALKDHLDAIIAQVRIACFCTASPDLAALRHAALLPDIP